MVTPTTSFRSSWSLDCVVNFHGSAIARPAGDDPMSGNVNPVRQRSNEFRQFVANAAIRRSKVSSLGQLVFFANEP